MAANDNKQHDIASQPAQWGLLRLAFSTGDDSINEGEPADVAVLIRAGLLRDVGGGRRAITDAGRRYARSLPDPPDDP